MDQDKPLNETEMVKFSAFIISISGSLTGTNQVHFQVHSGAFWNQ